jgi:hypothetical protein
LTAARRRASIDEMRRTLRALAALLAGLALVAAMPAPCGCAPERSAPGHTDAHACCTPPTGVSAADPTCCDESPAVAVADATPSPVGPATAPVLSAALRAEAPSTFVVLSHLTVRPAFSPPPTVLRV